MKSVYLMVSTLMLTLLCTGKALASSPQGLVRVTDAYFALVSRQEGETSDPRSDPKMSEYLLALRELGYSLADEPACLSAVRASAGGLESLPGEACSQFKVSQPGMTSDSRERDLSSWLALVGRQRGSIVQGARDPLAKDVSRENGGGSGGSD